MPFQPGQSGNPAGGAKIRRFFNALDRAIQQDDSKKLRAAAEKLLEEAEKGEPWAIQMLADRLDGKPAQQLIHSGDEDAPLVARVTREVTK